MDDKRWLVALTLTECGNVVGDTTRFWLWRPGAWGAQAGPALAVPYALSRTQREWGELTGKMRREHGSSELSASSVDDRVMWALLPPEGRALAEIWATVEDVHVP